MQYRIEPYRHYGDCLVLENGVVTCVLSLGFGPRILRLNLQGRENVFFEQPEDAAYLCSDEGWRVHGGTRLWLAPECVHNDYFPDNAPVKYEILQDGARVTQENDAYLSAAKSMTLRFTDDPHTMRVEYSITNLGKAPLYGAPWAVSMMQEGAVLTAEYGGVQQGAKPGGFLSLWGETSLADARLTFRDDCLEIRQTPADKYFKLGVHCRAGEASCRVQGQTFTKRFSCEPDATYPDNNVNLQVFCCRWMMEFETLAPMRSIAPDETAAHSELWTLR